MKVSLYAIGVLVLLCVAAFVTAGLLIPAERSFTNEIDINAPAEKVWQVLTDRSKYIEWQPNLTRVELIDERTWNEYPKDLSEPLRFSLVAEDRPRKLEIHYVMGNVMTGHWVGEITPSDNGVRLKTIDSYTANGWLAKIPIYIFFDYDTFAKDWNSKLKAQVEKLNR